MIIDSHTAVNPAWLNALIENNNDPYKKATIAELLEHMEKNGVDMAVVYSIAREPEQVLGVNDFVSQECKKHPDKLVGFANIYPPNTKEALKEIDRAVGELNMTGLKIHPIVQNFRLDHPAVTEVLDKAKEYDLPIIIHVSSAAHEEFFKDVLFTESKALGLQKTADQETQIGRPRGLAKPAYLAKVMGHYNDRKLYAAHLGGIVLKEVQKSNISFQTCGATVEGIEYAVKVVGADRIVFGSDYPFSWVAPGRAIEYELSKVKRTTISDADKRKILGENISKVLRV